MTTDTPDWNYIRAQFGLDSLPLHFAATMVSTHPRTVRRAIAHHRRELDRQPWVYLKTNLHVAEDNVCNAFSTYFGVPQEDVALTDGTTLGLTLLFGGLKIREKQEILTSMREFHGALHSIKTRARDEREVRHIPLFKDPAAVTPQEVLANLKAEVTLKTRVLALTWVYSNSGVKLPIAEISAFVKEVNSTPERADPADKLLFCVDGVVGLGVEDAKFDQLGCDFFVAGCHKFVFGPRGTGIWCGLPTAWEQCEPLAPTSSRMHPGRSRSPGGIHNYEQRWALREAFDFLRKTGQGHIAARTRALASRFKDGLAAIGERVNIVTPLDPDLSSAVVCFDIKGKDSRTFVGALETAGVLATVAPPDIEIDEATGKVRNVAHARVGLSIFNLESEVDRCLEEIDRLSR